MNMVFYITITAVILYALLIANPAAARAIVAELKRRWRLHLIRANGEESARALGQTFKRRACNQGYDVELVTEVFEQHCSTIAEALGAREANALIGEPTLLERLF